MLKALDYTRIKNLVNKYPNDADLGKAIRELVRFKQNKTK